MPFDVEDLVSADEGLVSRRIFNDEEIYRAELERIFARCWLLIGHESQVPAPGDFVQTWMGEDPVILCRDRSGTLRAFLNMCRHRGNLVCWYEQGNSKTFVCPYHGWSYATDGRLIGVPGHKEFYGSQLNREEWGLVPVARLETYKQAVFATFDPDAPPLEEYLGDGRWALDTILGQRESGTEVLGVYKWMVGCNWKFAADNSAGDTYHAPISHRSAAIAGFRNTSRVQVAQNFDQGFQVADTNAYFLAHLRLPDDPSTANHAEPLASYYRETHAEVESHLGDLRANRARIVVGTIFPNLSFQTASSMLHVWHPRGPDKIEIWVYSLADAAAPPEVKDQLRELATMQFGPTGLFEPEDGENWEKSTLSAKGVVAQRYPLNFQMGLGMDETVVSDGTTPPRVDRFTTERNHRAFYSRWAQCMSVEPRPRDGSAKGGCDD